MEYALIGCFNEFLEQEFLNIWKFLKKNNLSDYGFEVEGKTPHISFADFVLEDSKKLIELLNRITKEIKQIPVEFHQVNQFPGTTTLYYECEKTSTLLDAHTAMHLKLESFTNEKSYYIPKNWIPHATIASRLEDKIDLTKEKIKPKVLKGHINRFVLIEMVERVEGVPQGFKEIWSRTL